jgi:hypothetical protein
MRGPIGVAGQRTTAACTDKNSSMPLPPLTASDGRWRRPLSERTQQRCRGQYRRQGWRRSQQPAGSTSRNQSSIVFLLALVPVEEGSRLGRCLGSRLPREPTTRARPPLAPWLAMRGFTATSTALLRVRAVDQAVAANVFMKKRGQRTFLTGRMVSAPSSAMTPATVSIRS